jgi:hypothetical protein
MGLMMKKLLASKIQTRGTTKAASRVDSKKIFAIALSTFLVLVVVSEGVRLALQSL